MVPIREHVDVAALRPTSGHERVVTGAARAVPFVNAIAMRTNVVRIVVNAARRALAIGSQIVTSPAGIACSRECDICHCVDSPMIRVRATGERLRPIA